jgi:hypothetical protein
MLRLSSIIIPGAGDSSAILEQTSPVDRAGDAAKHDAKRVADRVVV